MSQYPIEPRNGLFPANVNRQLARRLQRMDTQALAVQHGDVLRVARVEQAAAHGLVAVAQISSFAGIVARSGF